MSDLTGELLRVGQDGVAAARPMAVVDVIRLGNRRRARTIAQRTFGGLTVLGVGAAAILGGSVRSPLAPPASSGLPGGITMTQTTSSAAGTMTIQVKYVRERHSKIKLLSATYSGMVRAAVNHPALVLAFGPPAPAIGRPSGDAPAPATVFLVEVVLGQGRPHAFSGPVPPNILGVTRKDGLVYNETLRVVLVNAQNTRPGQNPIPVDVDQHGIISAALILTP